ncbi:hypothetical protein LJR175_007624 [Variovorax sp. LjRoot175]|uniref:hypothetical protein n=1 Tax=Variovorax sp. LjRoot175 TaxID=3342276 RepID=UPI003ED14540
MNGARAELRESEEALRRGQAELAQREAAFEQARASLDAAFASSQQAREALEGQLAEHVTEGHRLRALTEQEIARLNALLQEAHAGKEVLRREHTAALAARDRDLREAEERHAVQERRLVAEVDRARQSSKQVEAGLAREQQRRIQSEEAAAQTLEAGRRMLRDTQDAAQQLERELRDQLVVQSGSLAQAQTQGSALQRRLDDLHQLLSEEKKSHKGHARCSPPPSQTCARAPAHVGRRQGSCSQPQPGAATLQRAPPEKKGCLDCAETVTKLIAFGEAAIYFAFKAATGFLPDSAYASRRRSSIK